MSSSSSAALSNSLTSQHYIVPESDLISEITHVALAFMQSSIFNQKDAPASWPLFTTVTEARTKFAEGTAIMVAIGGWGDTNGFSKAAETDDSRKLFARNVKAMVDHTGADGQFDTTYFPLLLIVATGVDIDWEYGQSYLAFHFSVFSGSRSPLWHAVKAAYIQSDS